MHVALHKYGKHLFSFTGEQHADLTREGVGVEWQAKEGMVSFPSFHLIFTRSRFSQVWQSSLNDQNIFLNHIMLW